MTHNWRIIVRSLSNGIYYAIFFEKQKKEKYVSTELILAVEKHSRDIPFDMKTQMHFSNDATRNYVCIATTTLSPAF